jgi:hypothetical protein
MSTSPCVKLTNLSAALADNTAAMQQKKERIVFTFIVL